MAAMVICSCGGKGVIGMAVWPTCWIVMLIFFFGGGERRMAMVSCGGEPVGWGRCHEKVTLGVCVHNGMFAQEAEL